MSMVRVTRGPTVESVHEGHIAVVDFAGATLFEHGDAGSRVLPRSAIKLLQALPLIESGAADAFGFTDAELALACSSHSGEPAHVESARSMMVKAGCDETCLACHGHWSLRQHVLIEQARSHDGTPGPLYNNCSGKHAGFLAVCRRNGWPTEGYEKHDHPLQRELAKLMETLTGEAHDDANRATDGCAIPTYAVPLRSLAHAMARALGGADTPPSRREAAARLAEAAMREPYHTAGSDRFCTDFMRAASGAAYAKTGAEGVYCGVLPDVGIAVALKASDGGTRASEVAFATVANAFLARRDLEPFEHTIVRTWGGAPVGEITVVPELRDALLAAGRGRR